MVDIINTELGSDLFEEVTDGDGLAVDDLTPAPDEQSFDVSIETDNGILEPVFVKTYSADSFGKHDQLTDLCGNSEVRNGGATGFQLTIEGILTLEQVRKAREIGLHEGQLATINFQPWVGEYTIDKFTFDKPSDLNNWYSEEYRDGVPAFTFQLTTKGDETADA